jgi:predicted AAA+ superfamily ATPase
MDRAFLSGYHPARDHIEVISGIRRCGKGTLMTHIGNEFKSLEAMKFRW